MGWFKNFNEKADAARELGEKLKADWNGTAVTFNHTYGKDWALGDIWLRNQPTILWTYNLLATDETVERIVLSNHEKRMCITFTDKRLIICRTLKGEIWSCSYSDLMTVQKKSILGTFIIQAKGNNTKLEISWTDIHPNIKDDFFRFLNDKILNDSSNPPVVAQNTISSADELLKYSELKNQGIITEEEFQAKKKQLLGL